MLSRAEAVDTSVSLECDMNESISFRKSLVVLVTRASLSAGLSEPLVVVVVVVWWWSLLLLWWIREELDLLRFSFMFGSVRELWMVRARWDERLSLLVCFAYLTIDICCRSLVRCFV